ncbi:GNAT family N-acetyltransferase [Candidatus Saccharibacteria bacterium]|nr:GNAT family N-acetyltransferase [Candidatus Saccharibacteria bacterium]
MKQSIIKQIPINHGGRLHTLFGTALENDFAYFLPDYRMGIRRANSRTRLQIATIHPRRLVLGLYSHGELVGYSICGLQANARAFLFWLYVVPNMRGKKLGIELLQQTEDHLKKRHVDSIELITHNQQSFYERHEYEMKKIMREIAAGVDMYVMIKSLK